MSISKNNSAQLHRVQVTLEDIEELYKKCGLAPMQAERLDPYLPVVGHHDNSQLYVSDHTEPVWQLDSAVADPCLTILA
jgi:hypothetical protein